MAKYPASLIAKWIQPEFSSSGGSMKALETRVAVVKVFTLD